MTKMLPLELKTVDSSSRLEKDVRVQAHGSRAGLGLGPSWYSRASLILVMARQPIRYL